MKEVKIPRILPENQIFYLLYYTIVIKVIPNQTRRLA